MNKTPIIDNLGWEDINSKDVTMDQVVDYLNDIILYYGPACEWCKYFDFICDRNHYPRNYDMKFGPYESFHFRKLCKDFEDKDNDNESTKKATEYTRKALDCFVQQYC